MKLRKTIALIVILMLALTAVACTKTTGDNVSETNSSEKTELKIKDGGDLVLAVGGDPQVLNPMYANDRVTMTINNALFDPLFVLEGEDIRYYLASDVSVSEDNLTYTIQLKENLKWHDGQPITADDLMFTIETILNKEQGTKYTHRFYIDGEPILFNKIDDITVEIKLPKLSVTFINTLSSLSPIPKHIFENETEFIKSSKNEFPIGSGPFKFKEWRKGESILVERFEDYYADKAHLDTIAYRIISDPNSSRIAFETGQISAKYVDIKDYEKYNKENSVKTYSFSEGMLNYFGMILTNEYLQNVDVRQAIAYALNKEEILVGAYGSLEAAELAYSVFAPNTLYYTDDVNKYGQDIQKSKELLEKAGLGNGFKLRLAYINSSKEQEQQGLIMQHQLKNVGIELELLPMDRGAFYQKLFENENTDFDMAFNGYVMGQDPDGYKSIFMTGAMNNFLKYNNEELDKLWEKASVEINREERGKIYRDIQQTLIDQMVQYPIAYPNSLVATQNNIGGVEEARLVPIFMFEDLSKLYIAE